MTYVGATPTTGDFKKLDSITTSSATTFNLRQGGVAVYPQSANHCIVSLNGVIQAPVDAFTIVNDTIVFASSLASSDVINFILVLGNVNDIGTPSDDTVSTAKIQANAVTSAKIASGVIPTLRPNAKPLIINGDMVVAQRATSKASISGGGYNTVDRYQNNNAGAFIGTWTQTQESLSSGEAFNDGFAKSLKMDCTTANGSPAANSSNWIQYGIEGQDLQLLKHGTSSAEKLTLSFWIKATKTGTNVVRLYKTDADRSCSQAYTVSSSNTWEKKVLNFPADTSGTVIANDNTLGMGINFAIAMGSNFTSGTLATSWAANTSANDYVGQVNNADSTSNNWEITGVQLEVGEYTSSTLPPFQHESYGDNLDRCSRYFQMIAEGNNISIGVGGYYTGANVGMVIDLRKVMRTTPSITQVSGTNYFDIQANDSTDTFNTFTITDSSQRVVRMYNNTEVSGTAGHFGMFRTSDSSAKIGLNAEL